MDIKFSKDEDVQTRSLRTLLRVAEVNSFAKAADQLNMTLSALSMQMKALEAELAVTLFDRSVRPPHLTPVGRSIVAEAIPLLQCEETLIEICRPSTSLVGRFRIGFVTSAAVRLLPSFIERASEGAPRAEFEFETGLSRDLQAKVVNRSLDAAIVTDADGLPETLTALEFSNEPFAYAAHFDLIAKGLDALLSERTFFHFMPDTGIGKLIAAEIAKYERLKAQDTIVLDNLETIMECVSKGLGFTLLPEADIDRYRRANVEKVHQPELPNRALVLVAATNGTVAKHLTALAKLLDPTI